VRGRSLARRRRSRASSVGATDPRKARKDTWRGRHHNVPADATDYYRNVLHAATDPSEVACNLRALGL
jgi:hypothetical protein